VGTVSFDAPSARIDAKGLGNGGRDLGLKKVRTRVGGQPEAGTFSIIGLLIRWLAVTLLLSLPAVKYPQGAGVPQRGRLRWHSPSDEVEYGQSPSAPLFSLSSCHSV
jgi:hypothetical protein